MTSTNFSRDDWWSYGPRYSTSFDFNPADSFHLSTKDFAIPVEFHDCSNCEFRLYKCQPCRKSVKK